jgi:hypothetical protein
MNASGSFSSVYPESPPKAGFLLPDRKWQNRIRIFATYVKVQFKSEEIKKNPQGFREGCW